MDDVKTIKHEVASDLVREYVRTLVSAESSGTILNSDPAYLAGWREALRSAATRMGVYPEFTQLLEATLDKTGYTEALNKEYSIGQLTMSHVLDKKGLTNLSDIQAVLDAIEEALAEAHIAVSK